MPRIARPLRQKWCWGLGFIDPAPMPDGQGSFDRVAGPILTMFDFDRSPNMRPLILDPTTGLVVAGDDHRGDNHGGNDHGGGRGRY
jgi:hypothetical protein